MCDQPALAVRCPCADCTFSGLHTAAPETPGLPNGIQRVPARHTPNTVTDGQHHVPAITSQRREEALVQASETRCDCAISTYMRVAALSAPMLPKRSRARRRPIAACVPSERTKAAVSAAPSITMSFLTETLRPAVPIPRLPQDSLRIARKSDT
jgi:hypothetical protein